MSRVVLVIAINPTFGDERFEYPLFRQTPARDVDGLETPSHFLMIACTA